MTTAAAMPRVPHSCVNGPGACEGCETVYQLGSSEALEEYRKSIDVVTRAHHGKEVREAVEREREACLRVECWVCAQADSQAREYDAIAVRSARFHLGWGHNRRDGEPHGITVCLAARLQERFATIRARCEVQATPAPEIDHAFIAYRGHVDLYDDPRCRTCGVNKSQHGTAPETKERGNV